MTTTTEGAHVHAIVKDDPVIKGALAGLAEARAVNADLQARSDAAHAEFEAARQAALDRGEVHSPPLEPVASSEVRHHLASREQIAEDAFASALTGSAVRLAPALAAREAEVLATAAETKPSALGPLVEEVVLLQQSLRLLTSRAAARSYAHRESLPASDVTLAAVIDAALSGTSLLGELPGEKTHGGHTGQVFADELSGAAR
jgi:hypothetical protein